MAVPAARADVEAFRVMEIAGRVETLDPASSSWRPLAPQASLSGGAKVRTGPKSWALFLLSSGVEEAMEMSADSAIELSGPASVRLNKGRIYLMMEQGGPRPFFSVSTQRGSVKIRTGGCLVTTDSGGDEWRVYGEEAHIRAGSGEFTVTEGFKMRLSDAGHQLSRMSFAEYAEWQAWTRKWYGKKDDVVYDEWDDRLNA
jgi:ferric-dicitrate binding protein FerR (iron transport regulator)